MRLDRPWLWIAVLVGSASWLGIGLLLRAVLRWAAGPVNC
jgi:hypothetical protein